MLPLHTSPSACAPLPEEQAVLLRTLEVHQAHHAITTRAHADPARRPALSRRRAGGRRAIALRGERRARHLGGDADFRRGRLAPAGPRRVDRLDRSAAPPPPRSRRQQHPFPPLAGESGAEPRFGRAEPRARTTQRRLAGALLAPDPRDGNLRRPRAFPWHRL